MRLAVHSTTPHIFILQIDSPKSTLWKAVVFVWCRNLWWTPLKLYFILPKYYLRIVSIDPPCASALARVRDSDGGTRLAALGAESLNLLDHVHALGHLAKHDVTSIQPRGEYGGDEELRAVGARTGVGHGQQALLVVLELEVLILKLLAVDGLATRALCVCGVLCSCCCVDTVQSNEGGLVVAWGGLSRRECAVAMWSCGDVIMWSCGDAYRLHG